MAPRKPLEPKEEPSASGSSEGPAAAPPPQLPPVTASPTGDYEEMAELVPDTPPPEEVVASDSPFTPEEATEAVSGHSKEAPKEELKVDGAGARGGGQCRRHGAARGGVRPGQ